MARLVLGSPRKPSRKTDRRPTGTRPSLRTSACPNRRRRSATWQVSDHHRNPPQQRTRLRRIDPRHASTHHPPRHRIQLAATLRNEWQIVTLARDVSTESTLIETEQSVGFTSPHVPTLGDSVRHTQIVVRTSPLMASRTSLADWKNQSRSELLGAAALPLSVSAAFASFCTVVVLSLVVPLTPPPLIKFATRVA